jgi:hypothetical protein
VKWQREIEGIDFGGLDDRMPPSMPDAPGTESNPYGPISLPAGVGFVDIRNATPIDREDDAVKVSSEMLARAIVQRAGWQGWTDEDFEHCGAFVSRMMAPKEQIQDALEASARGETLTGFGKVLPKKLPCGCKTAGLAEFVGGILEGESTENPSKEVCGWLNCSISAWTLRLVAEHDKGIVQMVALGSAAGLPSIDELGGYLEDS